MADRDVAGGILASLAGLCLAAWLAGGDRGIAAAGLFLAIAAGLVLVLGPTPEQRRARRRNPHAHPRLNPDRGWRWGSFSRRLWVADTLRDMVRIIRTGRAW